MKPTGTPARRFDKRLHDALPRLGSAPFVQDGEFDPNHQPRKSDQSYLVGSCKALLTTLTDKSAIAASMKPGLLPLLDDGTLLIRNERSFAGRIGVGHRWRISAEFVDGRLEPSEAQRQGGQNE